MPKFQTKGTPHQVPTLPFPLLPVVPRAKLSRNRSSNAILRSRTTSTGTTPSPVTYRTSPPGRLGSEAGSLNANSSFEKAPLRLRLRLGLCLCEAFLSTPITRKHPADEDESLEITASPPSSSGPGAAASGLSSSTPPPKAL